MQKKWNCKFYAVINNNYLISLVTILIVTQHYTQNKYSATLTLLNCRIPILPYFFLLSVLYAPEKLKACLYRNSMSNYYDKRFNK